MLDLILSSSKRRRSCCPSPIAKGVLRRHLSPRKEQACQSSILTCSGHFNQSLRRDDIFDVDLVLENKKHELVGKLLARYGESDSQVEGYPTGKEIHTPAVKAKAARY